MRIAVTDGLPFEGYQKMHQSDPVARADILREIQQLPTAERMGFLDSLIQLLREDRRMDSRNAAIENQLRAAAQALQTDYQSDPDLTAFTVLDLEDFHAAD